MSNTFKHYTAMLVGIVVTVVLVVGCSVLHSNAQPMSRGNQPSIRFAVPTSASQPIDRSRNSTHSIRAKQPDGIAKIGTPHLTLSVANHQQVIEAYSFWQPEYNFPIIPGHFYNRYRPRDPTLS